MMESRGRQQRRSRNVFASRCGLPPAVVVAVLLLQKTSTAAAEDQSSYDYEVMLYSYSYDCVPSYTSVLCNGGSLLVANDCGDDTCSDCASAMNYTSMTRGEFYCDDTMYYYDSDGDGSAEQTGPLMCYNDGCDDDGSYSYSYSYSYDDCVSAYTSLTCDGGRLMLSGGCDDSTCDNCGATFDFTADTGGMYYCDDTTYFIDQDLDGTADGSAPLPVPSCYWDSCGDDDEGYDDDAYAYYYGDDDDGVTIGLSLGLAGISCADYGTKEAAVMNSVLASLITGTDTSDFSNHTCTDASRRRALLDASAGVAIYTEVSVAPNEDDDGDVLSWVTSTIAATVSSGQFASELTTAAAAAGVQTLAAVSVTGVSTVQVYTDCETKCAAQCSTAVHGVFVSDTGSSTQMGFGQSGGLCYTWCVNSC